MPDRISRNPLPPEERLRRKLDKARARRDQWQRKYLAAHAERMALRARREWVETYLGFRIEYRLRGTARRLRRWRRELVRLLRG